MPTVVACLRLQNNIGEMMLAEGDIQGAVRQFQSILKQDEKQPHVWKNLGLGFAIAGLCDEARQSLQVALSHEPDNASFKEILSGICAGES